MSTKISSYNVQTATLSGLGKPKITSIQVANSEYVVTSTNTVSTSGGYVVINGTGFKSSVNVVIGSTLASSVTYVNSQRLNIQVPALPANKYIVFVTNTDNGQVAIRPNGITTV